MGKLMKIPKKIHIIWVGEQEFPYKDNYQTWVDKNPDFEVKLWTDENIPKLINQDIYDQIPINAVKADLLRIELLYKYGGLYVDADSVCKKPIKELVEDLDLFSGENAQTTNRDKITKMSNGFMGCKKGDNAMKRAVFEMRDYIKNTKNNRVHLLGRDYLGPILNEDSRFVLIGMDKVSYKGNGEYVDHENHNSWRSDFPPNKKRVKMPPIVIPKKKRKTTVVIMCAGNGSRWNNYLGVPKQMIEVEEEPLLYRTIRQLKERGVFNIIVTVPKKGHFGKLGVDEIEGSSDSEVDKFLNAKEYTNAIFLWGDCFFTNEAIDTILSNRKAPMFFGRCYLGGGIAKGWREIFALKANKKFFEKAKELRTYEGKIERCASWELYTFVATNHIPQNKKECLLKDGQYFTIIDDETDDFDYPRDYDRWIKNYIETKRVSDNFKLDKKKTKTLGRKFKLVNGEIVPK